MKYTYTYKKQGNGSDSWRVEVTEDRELVDLYMVYFLTCDNWKLKAVLNEDGLLTNVETALNNLPEPTKTNALFAWNNSPTIDSNSNTAKFIQRQLKLSNEDVTDIFVRAINFEI